jgi:[protein-PII] uridylyltransferase
MPNPFDDARSRLRHWLGGRPEPASHVAAAESAPQVPEMSARELQAALAFGPGVSARLTALARQGILAQLLPGVRVPSSGFSTRGLDAIRCLEQLLSDPSLTGKRFGAMLRELSGPDLLVLALLLRDVQPGAAAEARLAVAAAAFERLELATDSRHLGEFLVADDLRMAALAFRGDADDPQAVEAFASHLYGASLFNTFTTEEHLRMLALMTLVTLDAEGSLTPLKSELMWRLFVDTYNHLMKAYGDQVIDAASVRRTALYANRPPGIADGELVQFLEGLPKRYLTLFDADRIYEHVQLCRNIGADEVHCFLKRNGEWELTVATLDKPFLFSNICGVLSYLGMDILGGQALTSPRGLVLDLFRFDDPARTLEPPRLTSLLGEVIDGRVDVESLLGSRHRESATPPAPPALPVIAFDNETSNRYTVLEIVTADAPGLLYRISRVLSRFHCEIEMVVISTEEGKAIDVFHIRRAGAKVDTSDELPLSEALEEAVGSAL